MKRAMITILKTIGTVVFLFYNSFVLILANFGAYTVYTNENTSESVKEILLFTARTFQYYWVLLVVVSLVYITTPLHPYLMSIWRHYANKQ